MKEVSAVVQFKSSSDRENMIIVLRYVISSNSFVQV